MGEVIQLRDYQRKEQPKPETEEGEVIYCSPPVKDTASCEFTAPMDDSA